MHRHPLPRDVHRIHVWDGEYTTTFAHGDQILKYILLSVFPVLLRVEPGRRDPPDAGLRRQRQHLRQGQRARRP